MNFTYLTSTVCCCFRSKQKIKTLHANANLNLTNLTRRDFIDHEDADDENEDHVKKCFINSIWCKQCENNQTEFEKYEYYEICKNCDCQEQNDEQNDENKNEDCNTGLNEDSEQDYEQDYERDIDQDESEMNEETNEQDQFKDQFKDEEEELSEIEIEKDENDQTFDTFDDEYMNKKDN